MTPAVTTMEDAKAMLLALRNYLDKLFCKHEWEDVDEITTRHYEYYPWHDRYDLPTRTERTSSTALTARTDVSKLLK